MHNRIVIIISVQFTLIALAAQSRSRHGSKNSYEFNQSDNKKLINKLKTIMEDEDFKRIYDSTTFKELFRLTEKQQSNNATNQSESSQTEEESSDKESSEGYPDNLQENQSGEKYNSAEVYSMPQLQAPVPRPASEEEQIVYDQSSKAIRVRNKVNHHHTPIGSVYNTPKVLSFYHYEPQAVKPGQFEDNIDFKLLFQSVYPSSVHKPKIKYEDVIKAFFENFTNYNKKVPIKQPKQNKNPNEDNFFTNAVKQFTDEHFKTGFVPPHLFKNFSEWLSEYFKSKYGKKIPQANEVQPDIQILVTNNITEQNRPELDSYDEKINELYGEYETETFDSKEDKDDSQNSTVILIPENEFKSYLQNISEVIKKYTLKQDESKDDDLLSANKIKIDGSSDFWQKFQQFINGLDLNNVRDLLKNIKVNVNIVAVFETYLNGSDHNSNFHVNFNKTKERTDIDLS